MRQPPKEHSGKNHSSTGRKAVLDFRCLLTSAKGETRQPPIEAAAEEAPKKPSQERAIAASVTEETRGERAARRMRFVTQRSCRLTDLHQIEHLARLQGSCHPRKVDLRVHQKPEAVSTARHTVRRKWAQWGLEKGSCP
jgi:hypothetical protein